MKKWWTIISLVIIGFIIIIFAISNLLYPPLPVSSISSTQAITKLKNSPENVAKIAQENGYDWYITEMDKGKGFKNLRKMIEKKGWIFKSQEGSSFFFEKDKKVLIAETQMWTKKYIVFKIEVGWESIN